MFDFVKKDPGTLAIFIGILGNILLTAIKFWGGIWGNSAALIADAIHSLSDLLSDGIALFTYKIGQLPSDDNHPYGHGRFETVGSVLIGTVIALAGLGLLFELAAALRAGEEHILDFWVLIPAVLSILINEWLFWYTYQLGKKIHSPTLVANAWHHRSDAISSVAALAGIGGALAGWPILDPLAGGLVALMILGTGCKIIVEGCRDLMDEGLDEVKIEQIEEIILETPGISSFHQLRSRKVGGKSFIDTSILVDKDLTVSEGHHIAETLRRNLFRQFSFIEDALIHVDVEDDSNVESIYQASREELEKHVAEILKLEPAILELRALRLHYWKGKNTLEVFLRVTPEKTIEETAELLQKIRHKLLGLETVREARLYLDLGLSGK
jgi:cation diffusion facilitator family transporter